MGWLNVLPVFLLSQQADVYLWILYSVLPLKLYQYQPVLVEFSTPDCQYWLNLPIPEVLGRLSCLVFGIFPRLCLLETENFSLKSILISGLIFVLSALCDIPGIGVLAGLGGACNIGFGSKGMSFITGLLWVALSLELVIDCVVAVECVWFVILDSLFDATGLFFDGSDVWVIV